MLVQLCQLIHEASIENTRSMTAHTLSHAGYCTLSEALPIDTQLSAAVTAVTACKSLIESMAGPTKASIEIRAIDTTVRLGKVCEAFMIVYSSVPSAAHHTEAQDTVQHNGTYRLTTSYSVHSKQRY
jgi:hypothetical protein